MKNFKTKSLATLAFAAMASVAFVAMVADRARAGIEPCDKATGVGCISDAQASVEPCIKGVDCVGDAQASIAPCDRATGQGC